MSRAVSYTHLDVYKRQVLTCLIKYNSLYLLRLRHHLQCPFPGRDNRGRRVCEPERLPEPGFIQAVQAVFQNKVEDTAAEGITRTCSLNGVFPNESGEMCIRDSPYSVP